MKADKPARLMRMDSQQAGKGGARRRGVGRPATPTNARTGSYSVSLRPKDVRILKALGAGSLSNGVQTLIRWWTQTKTP